MSLIIDNISGGYGKQIVVRGVSFKIDRGEVMCVLGPNGCGKSTLLRILLGLLNKSDGNITVDGHLTDDMSCRELASKIAYIPQSHESVFPYTVLEMVSMGRSCHLRGLSAPKAHDLRIAAEALDIIGMSRYSDTSYMELSGGEKQLVLIARAICQQSDYLIMDEPTASLDYSNQHLITETVRLMAAKGKGIIMTTHSPEQPFSVADKVLLMSAGRVAASGIPEDVLTPSSMENVYGVPMDIINVKDRYGNARSICLPVGSATA